MTLDEAARLFIGVPFRHQGRDPSIGIDCIGLTMVAGEMAGLPFKDWDSTDYGRDPAHGLLESRIAAAPLRSVSKEDMQAGDIVTVDFKGATRHVGIVGQGPGYLTLIHTNGMLKRVTEARIDAKWLNRISAVYRST